MSRPTSRILLSFLLFFFACPLLAKPNSQTEQPDSKFLLIEGKAYEVVLVAKSLSKYGLDQTTYSHQHYDIYLQDFPQSEGRLTQVDGQWQGMLIHQGKIQIISDLSDNEPQTMVQQRYATTSLSPNAIIGTCGAEPEIPATFRSALASLRSQPNSATLGSMLASRINYNTFCETLIDGVCLVAELGVIFDSDFKTEHFGSNFQTQAIAILESVDLIYKTNFHIVFNRINLDFTAGDTLDSSTVIEDVLSSLALARIADTKPSYDINNNSILHFITGRDYTSSGDSAIGLAYAAEYTDSGQLEASRLCTPLASSTTQVIGNSNSQKVALTALTVAHELGHNFGFLHDGDSNPLVADCPDDEFIMAPYLDADLEEFSSCSKQALLANIASLSPIENCFDLPFDLTLSERSDSVKSTPSLQPFTTLYDVNFESKSSTGSVQVSGTVTGGGVTLVSAAATGGVCSLANANQSYTCTLSDPQPVTPITLVIAPTATDVILEQQIELLSGSNLFETDNTNNTLTSTIEMPKPGQAPVNLSAIESQSTVVVSWADKSSDETGFNLEKKINDGEWFALATGLAPDTQRFTDTNLISGERFHYRVTATFGDGTTGISNEANLLISTQVVQLISPSPGGGGGGSLGWISLILIGAFASFRAQSGKPN